MSVEREYGKIEMTGKDIAIVPTKFDRIAVGDRGELLFVSLVTDGGTLKRIRAVLNSNAKVNVAASGVKIKRPSEGDYWASVPRNLYATPDGYAMYAHRLPYYTFHAMIFTRMPGFMRVVTPESLWQELNDTRFTTPMLREWMPYIEESLRAEDLLTEAKVHGCQCGVLSLTTDQLDRIVTDGIVSGQITVPKYQEAECSHS